MNGAEKFILITNAMQAAAALLFIAITAIDRIPLGWRPVIAEFWIPLAALGASCSAPTGYTRH